MNYDSILRPKITVTHLALAKGWVNGLDLADLGSRYFPAIGINSHAMDLRQIKTTLLLVMQELALVATRAGISDGAILVRSARQIRPGSPLAVVALPSFAASRPSFQSFLDTLAHADSFSEEELLAAYEDRYPIAKKDEDRVQARRSRLLRRQLDIIGRLQLLLSVPIQLTDSVEGWFDQKIASRLLLAGIKSIEDLATSIALEPKEWHDEVSGIGENKARRIETFLQTQGLNLDLIKAQVAAKRQATAVQSAFQALDLKQLSSAPFPGGTTGTPPNPSPDPSIPTPTQTQGYDRHTPPHFATPVAPHTHDSNGTLTVMQPVISSSPQASRTTASPPTLSANTGVQIDGHPWGYDGRTPLPYEQFVTPSSASPNEYASTSHHTSPPLSARQAPPLSEGYDTRTPLLSEQSAAPSIAGQNEDPATSPLTSPFHSARQAPPLSEGYDGRTPLPSEQVAALSSAGLNENLAASPLTPPSPSARLDPPLSEGYDGRTPLPSEQVAALFSAGQNEGAAAAHNASPCHSASQDPPLSERYEGRTPLNFEPPLTPPTSQLKGGATFVPQGFEATVTPATAPSAEHFFRTNFDFQISPINRTFAEGYDGRTPHSSETNSTHSAPFFDGGTTVVPPPGSTPVPASTQGVIEPPPPPRQGTEHGNEMQGYDGRTPRPYPTKTPSNLETLDGSVGRFRPANAPPVIDAANDYEAMKAWLKNKKSPATVRVYEREIMRLMAWSVGVRARALTSLMHEDALAFRDFLSSIPPDLQTKKGPQAVKDRSPMREGVIRVPGFTQTSLSPASITKTLVIISGFFTWLQAMRYTTANPFLGVRAQALGHEIGRGSTEASDQNSLQALVLRTPVSEGRSLPQEVIEAVDDYLDSKPADKDEGFHARVRFIFYFAYFTGLRISEIAEARRAAMGFLQPDPVTGTPGGWYINIVGKGNKHRRVSVNDAAIMELERYLAHRGLVTLPCPSLDVDPGTFLVGGLVTGSAQASSKSRKIKALGDGVRPQTIHLTLKRLFRSVLAQSQFRDPGTLEKVRKASAHWLRHTSATHALANGVPIEVVSDNLGHASLNTTSIYIDSELRRNIEETRQGWARALAAKEARKKAR